VSVGLRLKHRRRRAGLSQMDLALKSGVGQHTISEAENDKREPQPRTLRKLASALDCEVADFFALAVETREVENG
jgi:transcriptional regulator with XRE-family HTH domain